MNNLYIGYYREGWGIDHVYHFIQILLDPISN